MQLDIGQVARRAGIAVSALRFYEQKGLLAPVGRRGLRRQYDAAVLERLALIALGRAAGFSLDDIASMLRVPGQPQIDRERLTDRADQLDRTIVRLCAVRDGLRHAAACPAPSHFDCPTFRTLLRAAGAGVFAAAGTTTPRAADD